VVRQHCGNAGMRQCPQSRTHVDADGMLQG
jgi:hypothetical protein